MQVLRRLTSLVALAFLTATFSLGVTASPAAATSSPARLPANFHISLPWAAGPELIECPYHGYNYSYACRLHKNVDLPLRTNDEYALDFGLRLGTPVVAVASGRVRWAGWARNTGWAGYGNSVSIAHYGAGTGFTSFYAHLSTIIVKSQQVVSAGQVIGYSGETGTEGGPHLHFAMYYNAGGAHTLYTRTTMPPYGGVATLPEPFSNCSKADGSACKGLLAGNVLRPGAQSSPVATLGPPAPPPATATAPPAPTNVTASGADTSHIVLAWTDNSGGPASYQVNRASGSQWVVIANVGAGSTSYTDGGLAASTTYQYLICAYNSAGTACAANGVSGTTTAGQGQPPPAPTNLSAVALDANRIQLTWTDTSNGAAQFQVFEGGTYLATVSTGTSWVGTGFAAGSTHCYQVEAFDLFGTSALSGSACATTPTAGAVIPAAPSGVTATAIDATTVRIAWTDNATNETGFRVSDGVTTTLVGQNPSQGYTYFDYPTSPSTWECFHVQAFNSAGDSAWSAWSACLTTPPAAAVIPAAPSGVTATAIDATTVRVAWTDNATNETGFRVSDGVTTQVVGQNSSQGYTYFDYPTNPSTWECFDVQAFNAAGSSAWSAWSPCITTPPAAAAWSVMLIASTTQAIVGDVVGLTAAANQSLAGTGYHLEIRHAPSDSAYAVCAPEVSACVYQLTWPMQGGTEVYAVLLDGTTVIAASTPFWIIFSAPG